MHYGRCGDHWGLQFDGRTVKEQEVIHWYRCWCGNVSYRAFPRNLEQLRYTRKTKLRQTDRKEMISPKRETT